MKLIAYLLDGETVDIRPAAMERDWMDDTDQRFAYRCLPLNIANTHGWEILCPAGFRAVWSGESGRDAIAITATSAGPAPALSHFGSAILTFRLPCIFRTEPGFDLMVQGPVNRPKDAIAPLSAVVETDWAPFSFTMNWMFTQPEIEVEFEAGEPFCHMFPIRRGEIEAVLPEYRPISADTDLQAQHLSWTASRARFNAELEREGSAAQAQRWQKHYQRGVDVDGRTVAADHRTRLKLQDFAPLADPAALTGGASDRTSDDEPEARPAPERDVIAAAFDPAYYLRSYPEIAASALEPLDHFLSRGWREGRNPNAEFDTAYYLRDNPDIAAAGANPFYHFLIRGRQEGRPPRRLYGAREARAPRIPEGVVIPDTHRGMVQASPILCRAPPADYLKPFRTTAALHNRYKTLDDYLRLAILRPNLIGGELAENDLRIVSMMDDLKRRLADSYADRAESELVSIVLPTRNRPDMIADAIVSVLLQSYGNWELIVVDDAGDARTEGVVAAFNDKRIRFHRLAEHSGLGGARNAGLRLAAGSIIAYLDDDNQLDPDFLLVSVHTMRDRGVRVLYSAQIVWRGFDADTRLGEAFQALRFAPFNRSLLESTNFIDAMACVHDRALLDECGFFDEQLSRMEDWDFFLRLTEAEWPAALPCILSHYFLARAPVSLSDNDVGPNLARIRDGLIERAGGAGRRPTSRGSTLPIFATSATTRRKRAAKLAGLSVAACAIVIPNFECIPELESCLESLAAHTFAPHDIIVADNNSSAPTRRRLDGLSGRANVRWIPADDGAGFSFAANAGIREALKGRYEDVVIINNDTIVTPDWLDELRYVLSKHPEVGMAVPRQVVADDYPHRLAHVPGAAGDFELDVNLSAHHDNVLDPRFDPEEGLVEVSYAPLFCMLIRTASLAAVGLFDTVNGPHSRSDWIFCEALRSSLRQKIVYTPHSKVYHLQGVATRAQQTAASA